MRTPLFNAPHRPARSSAGALRAGGFSLIELMVAITLGLFLVIGLVSLIVSNSVSRAELDKSSRQIENGRYALSVLTEDIEHAGFTGSVLTSTGTSNNVTPQSFTVCPSTMTAASLGYTVSGSAMFIPYAVYALTAIPSCMTSSNYKAGTAIIVVSRASTSTTVVGSETSTVAYLQASNCTSDSVLLAVNTAASGAGATRFPLKQKDCATASPLRPLLQRIYFVSTCNVCSGASADTLPTLKMVEYDASGALQITPLVEGIEDLRLYYGIDADNNGSPDSYSATPGALDWPNVVTVRIHVLARNEFTSAGWSETRTYDMGTGTPVGPFNDKYKRHVYSGVARLYNLSGQRELQ